LAATIDKLIICYRLKHKLKAGFSLRNFRKEAKKDIRCLLWYLSRFWFWLPKFFWSRRVCT